MRDKCGFKSFTDVLVLCHTRGGEAGNLPHRRQAVEMGGSRGDGTESGAPSPSSSHDEPHTHAHTQGLSNSWELNPAMRL